MYGVPAILVGAGVLFMFLCPAGIKMYCDNSWWLILAGVLLFVFELVLRFG